MNINKIDIKPRDLIARLVSVMEDIRIPLHYCLGSFVAILILRYLGEGYSQPRNYLNVASTIDYGWSFLHTVIGYIALGLGFVFIIHTATQNSLEKTAKIVLSGYAIIFLTPLLDLLITPLFEMSTSNVYIQPKRGVDIVYAYLTGFGGFRGMSLGLRIEIYTLTIAWYLLFRIKKCTRLKSLFYGWVCYTWLFFMACSPCVVSYMMNLFNIQYHYSNQVMINYYCVVSLLLAITLCWQANIIISRQQILNRQNCYILICLVIGSLLALFSSQYHFLNDADRISGYFHLALITISLFFVAAKAVRSQEISDVCIIAAILLVALTNLKLLYFFLLYVILGAIGLPTQSTSIRRIMMILAKIVLLIGMGYIALLYNQVQT